MGCKHPMGNGRVNKKKMMHKADVTDFTSLAEESHKEYQHHVVQVFSTKGRKLIKSTFKVRIMCFIFSCNMTMHYGCDFLLLSLSFSHQYYYSHVTSCQVKPKAIFHLVWTIKLQDFSLFLPPEQWRSMDVTVEIKRGKLHFSLMNKPKERHPQGEAEDMENCDQYIPPWSSTQARARQRTKPSFMMGCNRRSGCL